MCVDYKLSCNNDGTKSHVQTMEIELLLKSASMQVTVQHDKIMLLNVERNFTHLQLNETFLLVSSGFIPSASVNWPEVNFKEPVSIWLMARHWVHICLHRIRELGEKMKKSTCLLFSRLKYYILTWTMRIHKDPIRKQCSSGDAAHSSMLHCMTTAVNCPSICIHQMLWRTKALERQSERRKQADGLCRSELSRDCLRACILRIFEKPRRPSDRRWASIDGRRLLISPLFLWKLVNCGEKELVFSMSVSRRQRQFLVRFAQLCPEGRCLSVDEAL